MTAVSLPIAELRDLAVSLDGPAGPVELLRPVSLSLRPGTITALQGRSGTGKSTLVRAIMGTLPRGMTASGSLRIGGVEQIGAEERQRRALRGRVVSVAFQDTLASLNPVRSIADHFAEVTRAAGEGLARADWLAALDDAGIGQPELLGAYPWELSGGQLQRIGLALALVTRPGILLADEITTALDVVVQREVMDRLKARSRADGLAVLLVTHDRAVAGHWADHVVSLDGEADPAATKPRSMRQAGEAIAIEAVELHHHHAGMAGRRSPALQGVSLRVMAGEAVGIIGRSGAGKSTLLNCLAGLDRPARGTICWQGRDLRWFSPEQLRRARRDVQVVFQNALSTFDPRWRVGRIVTEPLDVLGLPGDRATQLAELLDLVGLDPSFADRDPATLSGGEQQRVAIARAIAPRPGVLLCDEPVASLDPHVRMRILALLDELRQRLGMAVVFVTHDLTLVPLLCSRVHVMAGGRIVDECAVDEIAGSTVEETRSLVAALPGTEDAASPPAASRPRPAVDRAFVATTDRANPS